MPIMQSCAEPKKFNTVLLAAMWTLLGVYLFFGLFCYVTFGADVKPIITEMLPPTSPVTISIKILFCFNLIFSYPICISPTNLVLEGFIFGSMRQSKLRKWLKNFSRFCVCLSAAYLAIELSSKMDKFLGLLGALCCAPLALALPAILHFKLLAQTNTDRIIDVVLVIVSAAILVFSAA